MKLKSVNAHVLAFAGLSMMGEAAVVYTEGFTHASGSNLRLGDSPVEWSSYVGATEVAPGADVGKYDRIGSSSNAGAGGTIGYLYTVNETTATQTFTAMDTATFTVAPTTITWSMANTSTSSTIRILILQGTTWYASNATYANSGKAFTDLGSAGALQTLTFSTTASAWRAFNFDPGNEISLGGVLASDLTSSEINGIGFFIENTVAGQTVRIDDLTINGTVPEPSAMFLSLVGCTGFFLLRRRAN
jgi:hypothetical protein